MNLKIGTRERLCALLCDLCELLHDQDSLILNSLLVVIEVNLFFGDSSPPDQANFKTFYKEEYKTPDILFKEPEISFKYYTTHASKVFN